MKASRLFKLALLAGAICLLPILIGSQGGDCDPQPVEEICYSDFDCPYGEICNTQTGKCIEAPQPEFCGGIAGFQCPEGQWCKLEGDWPDAGGECMDAWACDVQNDCVAQQSMGLLPTDMPCPGGTWAYYECVSGTCKATCPPVEPQTRCERLGGYCTYFLTECNDGFVGANEPGEFLGCPGGRSAKCCVSAAANPYACEASSDCVMVKSDCCGCQMGGKSVAVNADFADAAQPDPAVCAGIMCSAVYNCWGVAACINGLCGIAGNGSTDATCANSGGTIETGSCCQSASDFPNTCLIGACGCSPEYSHDVKVCACPAGKCFDGQSCVSL